MRLRNWQADCCTLCPYWLTITRQQIFKCSHEQVTAVVFLPTRASSEFFFQQNPFFQSTWIYRFNYENSLWICDFWSDIFISNFNGFNNTEKTSQCSLAHIRWESTHIRWSGTCSIGFIISCKIIVRVLYSCVFKGEQAQHLARAPHFQGHSQGISRENIPHFRWKIYYPFL